MTQKELLYVEDAYMHEDNIIKICNNIIDNLNDSKLISFMKKEVKKHQNMKDNLLSLLEDMCNE